MKTSWLLTLAVLTAVSSSAAAEQVVMDTPLIATTLPFSDRYASAFYTVDREHFNLVVAFSIGQDEAAQLIRQTIQLDEGQTYRLSIGGYATHQQATTLRLTRQNDRILAEVTICESRARVANCL